MTIRLVALGLFLLSSGFLHAASHDADAVPDSEQSYSANRAILIPYDYLPSGLYDPDVDAQPTGSIPLIPGTQTNPLLSAIEKQRDEALKKAREGKAMLAQQAQQMAEMMELFNPFPKPKSLPQQTSAPKPASAPLPQASGAFPVPRPVVGIVIPEVARGYEDIYRRFLGGKLIYTDPRSKAKTELPIGALANPLEGTFDLSGCVDTGQYLSISTGYRKAQKPENASKVEIWLAPWFLVNKNLSSSAKHLQPIMGSWDSVAAPVGLFWTWGGWGNDDYDYLVTNSLDVFGSADLWEKYKMSCRASLGRGSAFARYGELGRMFEFHF